MTAETYFWVLVGKFGGQALLQWILQANRSPRLEKLVDFFFKFGSLCILIPH
jgi:hypothetical protein